MTTQITHNIYVENTNGFTSKATLLVNEIGRNDDGKTLLDAIKMGSTSYMIMKGDAPDYMYRWEDRKVVIFHPGDRSATLQGILKVAFARVEDTELSIGAIQTSTASRETEEVIENIFGTRY